MNTSNNIKIIIGDLCKALCEKPDELKINCGETLRTVNIEIEPHAVDVSKVIGKQGANIKAICRLAERMGDSLQKRVQVAVKSDVEGSSYRKYTPRPGYEPGEEAALLSELLALIYHDGVQVAMNHVSDRATALMIKGVEQFDRELEKDLATIFNAIGKNKGHDLIVEFEDCEVMP